MPGLTRRQALRALAAGTAAPLFACAPGPTPRPDGLPPGDDPYGGFRMSLATYSLHKFPLERAVEAIRDFGLRYAEVNPTHLPVGSDPAQIARTRALFAAAGIRPLAFGVFYTERFKEDRAKALRDVFSLARTFGIRVISCDPEPDWLGAMEELAAKHDIRLGIHNHGPGARYDRVEAILKTLAGRHPNVGATVDVGHSLRSDENPVEVIRALGARVHGCHLKDARKTAAGWRFTPVLGRGELDLKGTLQALRDVGYGGTLSLEYEGNMENPFDDIRASLAFLRETARRL